MLVLLGPEHGLRGSAAQAMSGMFGNWHGGAGASHGHGSGLTRRLGACQ